MEKLKSNIEDFGIKIINLRFQISLSIKLVIDVTWMPCAFFKRCWQKIKLIVNITHPSISNIVNKK